MSFAIERQKHLDGLPHTSYVIHRRVQYETLIEASLNVFERPEEGTKKELLPCPLQALVHARQSEACVFQTQQHSLYLQQQKQEPMSPNGNFVERKLQLLRERRTTRRHPCL